MYEEFFGCSRRPFSATPDAACFIPLEGPQAALDALAVCCERGQGIGVLTGRSGLGKTLVGVRLAFELQPTLETVFLSHSSFPTRRSLLQAILFELRRPYSRMAEQELRLELSAALKALRPERKALALIIDESHHLSEALLDELRLLALLADRGEPLVRLVLIGNPELEERLAAPGLVSFNQRVCCQVELSPLTQAESIAYLRDSLEWSGASADEVFEPDALAFIARAADGVPRCLNQLSDHTLLLAYAGEQRLITTDIAQQALEDLKQLPLMWHDPIRGGEIYRGQSQTHTIEDSAVDLWPVRAGTLTRSESDEIEDSLAPLERCASRLELGADRKKTDCPEPDLAPFDHNSAAVEVGADAPIVAATRESGRGGVPIDVEIGAETSVSELTCLRQDWATVPPPEPHATKWNHSEKSSVADDRLTGEFDQSSFAQPLASRDAEFGTSSPESFQVEEFATTQRQANEPEPSLCDAICQSTAFASADHNSSAWNQSHGLLDSMDDAEFEEEPVIDRYVRKQASHDSTGLCWDINLLSSKRPVGPTTPPLPNQADFSAILAKPLRPEPHSVTDDFGSDDDLTGIVQDLHGGFEAAMAAMADNGDGEIVDNVKLRNDEAVAHDACGQHFSEQRQAELEAEADEDSESQILGVSDRDNAEPDEDRAWQLPKKLLEATNSEDDIESQIGADVLDLYLNTRHALIDRDPRSGTPTISLERPKPEDWSDLETALNDSDEWSDEPASEFDVVQPEPIGATVRVAEQAAMTATIQLRKPDIVQRAYSRLFSELRAKQR